MVELVGRSATCGKGCTTGVAVCVEVTGPTLVKSKACGEWLDGKSNSPVDEEPAVEEPVDILDETVGSTVGSVNELA